MKRVATYVDGLNLYHGVEDMIRHGGLAASWKWLDLDALIHRLSPRDSVTSIHYFTAHVIGPPSDVFMASRQQTNLRALLTIPHLEIHLGNFLIRKKRMPISASLSRLRQRLIRLHGLDLLRHRDGNVTVPVWRMEEKGTDVNLGVRLVADAFRNAFDKAMVISNDSDLVGPIRMVTQELGKELIVVNPRGHRSPAVALREAASAVRQLRVAAVVESQRPVVLRDERGEIHKPFGW